jgi:hypothetical protein
MVLRRHSRIRPFSGTGECTYSAGAPGLRDSRFGREAALSWKAALWTRRRGFRTRRGGLLRHVCHELGLLTVSTYPGSAGSGSRARPGDPRSRPPRASGLTSRKTPPWVPLETAQHGDAGDLGARRDTAETLSRGQDRGPAAGPGRHSMGVIRGALALYARIAGKRRQFGRGYACCSASRLALRIRRRQSVVRKTKIRARAPRTTVQAAIAICWPTE